MSDRNQLHIGIDGGGSNTSGVLCRLRHPSTFPLPEIRVLRRCKSGPANWLGAVDSNRRTANSLTEVIKPLLEDAARCELTAVTVAAAGLGLKGRRRTIERTVKSCVPSGIACRVISDTRAAHNAAGIFADGITVISGTGSVAVTQQAGRWLLSGGYGFVLGDEGSGFWIAQQGLQAAIRADEGRGPQTVLSALARQYFEVNNLRDLPAEIHSQSGAVEVVRIARFCPVVFSAARGGDAAARQVIEQAACHLARLAVSVARCAGIPERQSGGLRVFTVGGVWRGASLLWEDFTAHLECRGYPQAQVSSPVYSPAEGAVLASYLTSTDWEIGRS